MSDVDPTIGRRTATDPRMHVRMTADFFLEPGKFDHIADPVVRMATLGLAAASFGWCRKNGTDGHVLPEAVLAATGLPPEYGKTMITDGVWHQADHSCPRCPQPRLGLVYHHDFLEHNRSAAQERRTIEKRRSNGADGAAARWAGHTKPASSGRGPGRPPKTPTTPPAIEEQLALVPVPAGEQVLPHPAEIRARAVGKRGQVESRVYPPIVDQLCTMLADKIRQNGFTVTKAQQTSVGWREAVRLMLEKDGRTERQIANMITWCQDDFFWYKNIHAMPKLRQRYERMREDTKDPRRDKVHRVAGEVRGPSPNHRRPAGSGQPPAALAVTGMAGILAQQMGSTQGGMVKGVQG